jgi:hypothetical protein
MGHSAPALVLATLCFVGPAAARGNCNIAYDFDQGALSLGKVKPVVRKTFFEPDNVNEPNVYVIGGDELVIGEQDGTFVCALYVNRKGVETMGWLKAADIVVSPVGDVPYKQWLGKWTAGGTTLKSNAARRRAGSILWARLPGLPQRKRRKMAASMKAALARMRPL